MKKQINCTECIYDDKDIKIDKTRRYQIGRCLMYNVMWSNKKREGCGDYENKTKKYIEDKGW